MSISGQVAVTGMGLATPLGIGVENVWKGVRAGATGISRHSRRDDCPESLRYFGTVDGLDRPDNIPSNLSGQVRFLNRGSILGFEAAREAMAGLLPNLASIPRERRALFIASGDLGSLGYEFMHPALREATKEKSDVLNLKLLNKAVINKVNPFFLLESICNNLFSFLSAVFEFMGPNTTLASFSPCGSNALELASRKIRTGEADVALAVGCGNWVNEIPMFEMDGLGILSKCRHREKSFRPLDRSRDGFIPGEGGAAILLENAEKARERGSRILARIAGIGNKIEFPSGKGISVPEMISKKCIESALEEGSFEAKDLAFICPHGSGTRKGDRSELRSIAELLGGSRKDVPVCALKPYTGHMGAASDICEVIIGIRALSEGIVPATPNFERAEAEFDDMPISASVRKTGGRSFLSISYGILGQSSTVLVEVP